MVGALDDVQILYLVRYIESLVRCVVKFCKVRNTCWSVAKFDPCDKNFITSKQERDEKCRNRILNASFGEIYMCTNFSSCPCKPIRNLVLNTGTRADQGHTGYCQVWDALVLVLVQVVQVHLLQSASEALFWLCRFCCSRRTVRPDRQVCSKLAPNNNSGRWKKP